MGGLLDGKDNWTEDHEHDEDYASVSSHNEEHKQEGRAEGES